MFKLVKFETMNDRKDAAGRLLPDEQRLTKAGIFARRTSREDMPQVHNVLVGGMSRVGPRPVLSEYLHLTAHSVCRGLRETNVRV